jgi:diguanylate cyclase (GGDEF)-like protein
MEKHKVTLKNIIVLSFTVVFSLVALAGVNIFYIRKSLINDAYISSMSNAKLLNSDVERVIYGVEEMFSGLNSILQYNSDFTNEKSDIRAILDERMNSNPQLMDILILDNKGAIINWTRDSDPPNVLDREYVYHHLNNDHSSFFIGRPKLSKVHDGKWFFGVSKSYFNSFGDLENILVAIIDLEYFHNRYSDVPLVDGASIVLASERGDIYTRIPDNHVHIGKNIEVISEFVESKDSERTFIGVSPIDNLKRIVTFKRSSEYPIVTISSYSMNEVLKPWQKQVLLLLFVLAILMIFLYVLMRSILNQQKEIFFISTIDGLSGLKNRRYFYELAYDELERCRRYGMTMSVVMIDIDDFKHINDTYGHCVGDFVIKKIGSILNENTRKVDLCARYGGEEFVVLLTCTNISGALNVAEKIRSKIANIEKVGDFSFNITASIGVSELCDGEKLLDSFMKRADDALYEAKRNGKNRVIIG